MQTKHKRSHALLLALTLALAGCQPSAGAPPVTNGDPQIILGQNALISNNAASLSGTVMGPATLISNNGAGYRIAATAPEMGPVKQAMVYLTTPDERFYAGADGKALFAITDDEGRYAFPKAPGEEPVVITVLFEKNRRLVGFLTPAKGENTYHVNLATTVIAEFLRDHASLSHKTMADFPKFQAKLPEIMAMTQELIDNGKIVVNDLSVSEIPAMNHAYVRAFGKDYKELGDAWEEVLGYRPYLLEDYDVGISAGMRAIAVTTLDSEIYVAAENNASLEIIQANPAGGAALSTIYSGPLTSTFQRLNTLQVVNNLTIAGVPGKKLVAGNHSNSTDWGFSIFDLTQEFQPDAPLAHRMYVRDREENVNERHEDPTAAAGGNAVHVAGDDFYVASEKTDTVYTYKASDIVLSTQQFPAEWGLPPLYGVTSPLALLGVGPMSASNWFNPGHDAAGTPATSIKVKHPAGITKHGDFLYVSESATHRIRKLDLTTGTAETVLGQANTTVNGNVLRPPTALEGGKLSDSASKGFVDLDHTGGVPVEKAYLSYPHGVVFDAEGNMLVADTDHRRVRMLKKDGRVYTLAGTVAGTPEINGDSRRTGLGEIWSIALDAEGNLLIADARGNRLRRLWLNPTSKK